MKTKNIYGGIYPSSKRKRKQLNKKERGRKMYKYVKFENYKNNILIKEKENDSNR